MEFGARVICGVFVLLASMCYLCQARANNRGYTRTTPDISKTGAKNQSRNASNETDLLTNTPATATATQRNNAMPATSHIENEQLKRYKSATIGLTVLCAIMFFALMFLTMRSRAKSTSKKPDDTPIELAKQPAESEYQSIRGLPRRETGNSYGYETVKPRLPPTRPSIAYLLQPNESEYENLKSHDLKTRIRESNLYMPMNEALAGSGLTGNAAVLSGEDEDLYLTMKRLITPEDTAVEINDLGSI